MSTRPPTTATRPPTESHSAAGPSPATTASTPTPRRNHRPRRRWGRWLLVALVLVVLVVLVGGALRLTAPPAEPATPTATPAAAKLTARGRVQPVQQARIGTLTGGVVTRLSVVVGEPVGDQQEVARVRGPGGSVEVLTAPWAGTVTAVPVNYGDTVTAGAVLVMIGDLSRLQVETTDVDEFLIGKLARGQAVRLTVDALDGRQWDGVVSRITLQPQPASGRDEHYPITIDLTGPTNELRPGMTVRVQWVVGS